MFSFKLKIFSVLFLSSLLSILLSCKQSEKPANDFKTEEKTIIDIDGDGLEDFVFSSYIARGCHTLGIDLSTQEASIYTDYEIYLGYLVDGDTAEFWKENIKIKDFDEDGKYEVFAEIFTCCDGQVCWDKIPDKIQKEGITSNFVIIEYEDSKLITKSIPFSISPEQYYLSQKVRWNQDLVLKKENGKYGYVDKEDNWIILPELDKGFEFTANITAANWKGAEILINKRGEIINDFGIFSESSAANIGFYDDKFDENGLLLSSITGSMFFLDTLGHVFQDQYFCDASFFSEGLAKVQKQCDDKIGYVNKDLKWVISPKFDSASSFENGKAEVEYKGKKWLLHKNGTLEKRE